MTTTTTTKETTMPRTTTRKRNMYPGTCTVCNENVGQYQGTIEKVDGRWVVTHDRCPAAVEAERQANEQSARERFDAALAELATHDFTPVQLVELRILKTAQFNRFVNDKVALVTSSESLEQAKHRIGLSCQGMTMDYMTEFARESEAARLATEYAEAKFS